MTPMRIREIRNCAAHRRTLVVLEDVGGRLTLTFSADPEEARRLVRVRAREGCGCQPVYDFVQALLAALGARLTRVVLEDARGQGIAGRVWLRSAGGEQGVPCYPPDALALALRAGVPVYATADALAHAEPVPGPPGADPVGDVARWLERVRPDDFSA